MAEHRVGLARARLPVGHHGGVEAVERIPQHHRANVRPHALLARVARARPVGHPRAVLQLAEAVARPVRVVEGVVLLQLINMFKHVQKSPAHIKVKDQPLLLLPSNNLAQNLRYVHSK